ncbi:hypothetical protein BST33_09260 [Mycolicibacter minnesotensis]|uniref:Uncharacterized protein n=1 Tax=Mycolicibacter minnesotensis TaxID=1118379 RepID=A0AA91M6N9_9MYCO|nr:hypothetical protein BST33_09260 [Mycolicibacter minnesotensis]
MRYTIPAYLALMAGILAGGLVAMPTASDLHASGCFMTKDGNCEDVPDPTQYGCPPGDFQCMFDAKLGKRPPGSES